jgi:hypothetical protein
MESSREKFEQITESSKSQVPQTLVAHPRQYCMVSFILGTINGIAFSVLVFIVSYILHISTIHAHR